MNYKRRRTRRTVRCTICTPHRWRGNSRKAFSRAQRRLDDRGKEAQMRM